MKLTLRIIAVVGFIVGSIRIIVDPSFDALLAFLASVITLLASFVVKQSSGESETLDQHNRRVMLNHVESFWVKGILEKSLHGAALIELGMKEDPNKVNSPWVLE